VTNPTTDHHRPTRATFLIVAILILAPLSACHHTARPPQVIDTAPQPRTWAQPLDIPGLPNGYKVSDDLYRGAQPDEGGIAALKTMGVRTVVNLRSTRSDRELVESTGIAYEHIYMQPWHPEREEVVRFLRITTDPARTPVFVHCQRGADRTGMMCAIYRIVVQDWPKQDAIDEMVHGGFDHDTQWDELTDFIRAIDIQDLREELEQ
jgi:protein tyrosine phosphatase (PTP) superfamily phosphohydrolase (DUF442 family)